MEALEYGLRGICVPRELARDEHVDNNQVDFARYFASEGKIELPDGRDELFALLDKAIENPSTYRFDPSDVPAAAGHRAHRRGRRRARVGAGDPRS